ncbi:hypothetical protein EW145_g2780 [Phellinidium pouzarii]|uniref:Uncharacterized protein n=1 Tax=Phellinidium pouzarii TaxID=167371 RepID=A0A4S4LA09_9AGAM|nr:hypothetical protein EW145_g2780 [Phellinidium pouzarii]
MANSTTVIEITAIPEGAGHQLLSDATLSRSLESSSNESKKPTVRALSRTPVSVWTHCTTSSSSQCVRPHSILINGGPMIEVTSKAMASSSEPVASLYTDGESQTRASTTSNSGSDSGSTSAIASAASSLRTRTTTLSSTSVSQCVSFAPLPSVEPRPKGGRRPLGLAARGQLLRQRRMQLQGDDDYYEYDNTSANNFSGQNSSSEDGEAKPYRRSRKNSDLDEDEEDPFVTLGKALNDATKVIWRRLSHGKLRRSASASEDSGQTPQRQTGKSFGWRGLKRSNTLGAIDTSPSSKDGPDDDDSEDDTDGTWRRRKNEDPMTKTIMENSDDGHGGDSFVVAYDVVLEEEDLELARVHDEIRTTVEVHVVKAAEGISEPHDASLSN